MKVSDAADSIKAAFRTASLFLVRHAPKIVFGCFTTGNTLLAAKAGLHMDMDTASGALFIVQSICLGFTGRYPTASFRCAGVTGILASACLSAKGIDTNSGHVLDWWRAAATKKGAQEALGKTKRY